MKKFKTKRSNLKKRNIMIIVFLILFIVMFILISFKTLDISHYKFVNLLINHTAFKEKDNEVLKLVSNFDLLINDYSFNNKKLVYHNSPIKDVYIYNTHNLEEYSDKKNVFDASILLASNLKKLGINSLVEIRKASDYINTGLNYYEISRSFIIDVMKKKEYAYYIDIHRDSVKDTKVTINNKDYAKILFVLGKDNASYEANKSVILEMNEYLNNYYPGLSKGILEKSGKDVNGVYNQDLDKNVLLIEIGGIENNIEEVNNSTEILSLMLYSMLGD